MSEMDKMKNKAEELIGKGKEEMGKHDNDPDLIEEGQNQQDKADLKQTGEKIKDAADDLKDKFKN